MQIKCTDDGEVGTDVLADELEPVSVGICCIFSDGCSVRCHEESVERSGGLQAGEEHLGQL